MTEGQRIVAGGVTESTYATSREAMASYTAPAAHANLPRIEGFFCKMHLDKERLTLIRTRS